MILLPYSSFIFQKSTSFWILFKLTGLEVIGSVTHTCFIKKNLGRDKWAQHKRVVTWWELSNRNHCNLFYQNPLKTIDDVEAQMEYCQISLLNGLWQNLFNVLSDLNEMNKWATSANESGNVHGIPYNWLEPERKKKSFRFEWISSWATAFFNIVCQCRTVCCYDGIALLESHFNNSTQHRNHNSLQVIAEQ